VPEGGVPGPRPSRRQWFEEVVWGAVGRVSATRMSPKSPHGRVHGVPDEGPPHRLHRGSPRKGREPDTPPAPRLSPAAQAPHRDTANAGERPGNPAAPPAKPTGRQEPRHHKRRRTPRTPGPQPANRKRSA